MKDIKILILVILFASCNCGSTKNETSLYQKDQLSFLLPKYWKVERDRPIEGIANSRFISVGNNKPLSGEEFFLITAIASGNSLAYTMANLIKQSRISYAKRRIQFSLLNDAKELTLGKHKALRVDFETKVITNRNKGSFTVFDYNNKTYSFVSSAAAKNVKEHTATIDSVIKSLK